MVVAILCLAMCDMLGGGGDCVMVQQKNIKTIIISYFLVLHPTYLLAS